MRISACVIYLFSTLIVSFGQTTARRPTHSPPGCRPITEDMLGRSLVLPEGCYTIDRFRKCQSSSYSRFWNEHRLRRRRSALDRKQWLA